VEAFGEVGSAGLRWGIGEEVACVSGILLAAGSAPVDCGSVGVSFGGSDRGSSSGQWTGPSRDTWAHCEWAVARPAPKDCLNSLSGL
jgi:hypothetical protein